MLAFIDFLISERYGLMLVLNLWHEREQVDNTYCHHSDSCYLACSVAGKTHQEREYCATEKTHNHQSAYLILMAAVALEGV